MKPPHVERMETELAELRRRKCKLATFIHHNPIFLTLTAFEKGLLRAQEAAMTTYEEVLDTRIALALQPSLPLEA
jgi:hypothetical protein